MQQNDRLRPGDLVEVRMPDVILSTLDSEGALDSLPFMAEMVDFCGRRFRVSNRALKVCFTGRNASPRSFRNNDVVLLEDLRCSGAAHDGCQKSCTILWREKWLRKVADSDPREVIDPEARVRLRCRLKTSTAPGTYFCQASEILKATDHLSKSARYAMSVAEVREGNCSTVQMILHVARFAFWKMRLRFLGDYRRGKKAAADILNLRPGEVVEVKSVKDIVATLDENASHRGLVFMRGMHGLCGKQVRVKDRIDKIIVDGTGEMRNLRDTVQLEDSLCGCDYQGVGGCSRREINYWREIWLRRSQDTVCTLDCTKCAPAAVVHFLQGRQ